mmetsp:Transcript_96999/g.230763  ORF Transcript_96999/g.230763 Transcript_96999/m.230763 type:complete len:392 (-) Transcript_96999:2001-3176(-)
MRASQKKADTLLLSGKAEALAAASRLKIANLERKCTKQATEKSSNSMCAPCSAARKAPCSMRCAASRCRFNGARAKIAGSAVQSLKRSAGRSLDFWRPCSACSSCSASDMGRPWLRDAPNRAAKCASSRVEICTQPNRTARTAAQAACTGNGSNHGFASGASARPWAVSVMARDSVAATGASSTSATSSAEPVVAIRSAAAHCTSDIASLPEFWLHRMRRASASHELLSVRGKASGLHLCCSRMAAASSRAKAFPLSSAAPLVHFRSSADTVDLQSPGSSSRILATLRLKEALMARVSPTRCKASSRVCERLSASSGGSQGPSRSVPFAHAAMMRSRTLASSADASGSCFASSLRKAMKAPGKNLARPALCAASGAISELLELHESRSTAT